MLFASLGMVIALLHFGAEMPLATKGRKEGDFEAASLTVILATHTLGYLPKNLDFGRTTLGLYHLLTKGKNGIAFALMVSACFTWVFE